MSARRLDVLLRHLPLESATLHIAAKKTEPKGDPWSREETLLGLVVERLDALHMTTAKAAGGKIKGKVEPIVPRPKKPKAKPQSTKDIIHDLDTMMAAVGGDD